MATPLAKVSSHHVQAVVSEETHKGLRDIAYESKTPARDILRNLITDFVAKYQAGDEAAKAILNGA